MVGCRTVCVVYAFRCGSANHQGSPFTTAGMHGTLRPSPTFRYSFTTFGWIKYLRNSFATATFCAPFGIRPQVVRAWLDTVGGDLEAEPINVSHPLRAQLFLDAFEEIIEGIPGLWNVFHVVARLLDQVPPNVVGRHRSRVRNPVKAAPLFDAVVAIRRE